MYSLTTKEDCAKAIQAATSLVWEKLQEKDLIMRSLRIGFALEFAHEPTSVIVAGFLRDAHRRKLVSYQDIFSSFGFLAMDHIDKCQSIDRYYYLSTEHLRRKLMGDSQHQDFVLPIKLAEIAEDIKHIRKLSPEKQTELIVWAESWLESAQAFSSPNHPLAIALGRKIECAKDTILDTTFTKGVQQCSTQIPIEQ